MSQCKMTLDVEGKAYHRVFCIKDEGHEGLHEIWMMPFSMYISVTIKEWLWYRWLKN